MEQFVTFVIHHWFLWSSLLIIIILIALLEVQKNVGGTPNLTPQQLIDMINHEDAWVIDLRSAENFKAGHILGAQNIQANDVEKRVNKLNKQKTLILVDLTGAESLKMSKQVRQLGFEKVYNLQGGMNSWKNAGLPVTKG